MVASVLSSSSVLPPKFAKRLRPYRSSMSPLSLRKVGERHG